MKWHGAILDAPIGPNHKMTLSSLSSDLDAPNHKMTLAVAGSDIKTFTEMEQEFARSEEVHNNSMVEIAKSLTFPKAMDVIEHSTLLNANSTLSKVTGLLAGSQKLRSVRDTGFGGVDGARKLLNSMILE